MKKWIVTLMACLAFSFAALAAEDPTGNWQATIDTPDGGHDQTFALRMDGDKLTGTIGAESGNLEISDGKMNGDKISFSATGGQFVLRYSGTISGDKMTLVVNVGDGQFVFNVKATRVKA